MKKNLAAHVTAAHPRRPPRRRSFVAAFEEESQSNLGGGGGPGDEGRVYRVRGAVDDLRRSVVVADMHVRNGIRQLGETRSKVDNLEVANVKLTERSERAAGDVATLESHLDDCEKQVAALRDQLYLQVDAEEAIRQVTVNRENVYELESSMATLVKSLCAANSREEATGRGVQQGAPAATRMVSGVGSMEAARIAEEVTYLETILKHRDDKVALQEARFAEARKDLDATRAEAAAVPRLPHTLDTPPSDLPLQPGVSALGYLPAYERGAPVLSAGVRLHPRARISEREATRHAGASVQVLTTHVAGAQGAAELRGRVREAETRAHVAGAALAREQGERRAQQVRRLRTARLCLCLRLFLRSDFVGPGTSEWKCCRICAACQPGNRRPTRVGHS